MQERLDAEVGQRRTEEHRRERAVEHRRVVPRMPGVIEQVELVAQRRERVVAKDVGECRIVERNAAWISTSVAP